MNSNIVTVGKKIRQIREAVGLSRPKFADLLGVPPTTLKNYELGYREVGTCIYNGIYNRFGKDALLFVMANVSLIELPENVSYPYTPVPDGKVFINGGYVDKTDAARFNLGVGDSVAFGNYSHNQYCRAQ